jgi:hypothetical protein
MFDIAVLALTLGLFWYIISISKYTKSIKKTKYSQSSIHKIIKNMLDLTYADHPSRQSQSEKHAEKNSIRVIFMDNKAYWVANNVFYCANAIDGNVDRETAQPINTEDISKEDIDKLLFILDKLGSGSNNDSGGSGDKRL